MGALHPQWIHRSKIDQLGALFADVFRKIGDYRLPICVGPEVASQLFACWNSITDPRIAKNGGAPTSNDPALSEYFGGVSRNVHRARVRLTLKKYRGQMGSRRFRRNPFWPDCPSPYWVPNGIRFRIPQRPGVMPSLLLLLGRTQGLAEWTPLRFLRAIWSFPIVMPCPLPLRIRLQWPPNN